MQPHPKLIRPTRSRTSRRIIRSGFVCSPWGQPGFYRNLDIRMSDAGGTTLRKAHAVRTLANRDLQSIGARYRSTSSRPWRLNSVLGHRMKVRRQSLMVMLGVVPTLPARSNCHCERVQHHSDWTLATLKRIFKPNQEDMRLHFDHFAEQIRIPPSNSHSVDYIPRRDLSMISISSEAWPRSLSVRGPRP